MTLSCIAVSQMRCARRRVSPFLRYVGPGLVSTLLVPTSPRHRVLFHELLLQLLKLCAKKPYRFSTVSSLRSSELRMLRGAWVLRPVWGGNLKRGPKPLLLHMHQRRLNPRRRMRVHPCAGRFCMGVAVVVAGAALFKFEVARPCRGLMVTPQ